MVGFVPVHMRSFFFFFWSASLKLYVTFSESRIIMSLTHLAYCSQQCPEAKNIICDSWLLNLYFNFSQHFFLSFKMPQIYTFLTLPGDDSPRNITIFAM